MLIILTPPASEPVTLAEAKLQLRVTHANEDSHITGLIQTARELVEASAARAFMPTAFRLTLPAFPGQAWAEDREGRFLERPDAAGRFGIRLPRAPVASVQAVSYLNSAGTRTTLASNAYEFEAGDAAVIYPVHGTSWPAPRTGPGSVRVDFTAGYADAASVPAKAKHAIKLLLTHLYYHRGDGPDEMPRAVHDLVAALGWGHNP